MGTIYNFKFSYNKYRNGKIFGCGIKFHTQRSPVLEQKDVEDVIYGLEREFEIDRLVIADVRLN